MGSSNTRSNLISRDASLIAGVQKHLKGVTLTLSGQALTDKQIVSALQDEIDAENAVTTAHSAWLAAVQAAKTQQQSSQETMLALRQTVMAMFRSQPDVLADFGLSPHKPRAKASSAQNAAKAAKAKATRAARGTLGSVQKAKIKGNVSSIDIVPVTVPNATNGSNGVTTQKV
jgi:hypothetical protein